MADAAKDPFKGRQQRIAQLKEALKERIVVLDGAAGTFQTAVTPGQAVLFYSAEEVLGGGWID